MLLQIFCDLMRMDGVIITDVLSGTHRVTSLRLGWTDPVDQTAPANFALGSASSQLQEVLVTDLPKVIQQRRAREGDQSGEEGERARWKREGEGTGGGRIEKDRFFNFHCST